MKIETLKFILYNNINKTYNSNIKQHEFTWGAI